MQKMQIHKIAKFTKNKVDQFNFLRIQNVKAV